MQARSAEGHLHLSLLRDVHNTYWTRTVWTSEQAMKSFMISGAHRKAMPHLLNWCDGASVAHWTLDTSDPPTWVEAHAKLLEIGRPSKVLHPTEAHRLHQLPPPHLHVHKVESK